MPDRPLWTCSRCGRTFANRNQSHTCAALGSVDARFDCKDSAVRAAFDRVLAVLAPLGPVEVVAERSRTWTTPSPHSLLRPTAWVDKSISAVHRTQTRVGDNSRHRISIA